SSRPSGCASFFSTGTVTTSPVCTVISSATASGGRSRVGAATGTTRTSPTALCAPFDAVYRRVTGRSRRAVSATRSTWWSSTAAVTPASASTDVTTSTPPDGSVSLASTSTSAEPPAGSSTVSPTTTGGPASCGGGSTSTRTRPIVESGPSLTW